MWCCPVPPQEVGARRVAKWSNINLVEWVICPTKNGFPRETSQALEVPKIVSLHYKDVAFLAFVFHLKWISWWQGYHTQVRTAASGKVCLSCNYAASTNSSAITVPVWSCPLGISSPFTRLLCFTVPALPVSDVLYLVPNHTQVCTAPFLPIFSRTFFCC